MIRKCVGALFMLLSLSVQAQTVALDSACRDADYVRTILGRSQKIVDALQLQDAVRQQNVLNVISNRYFKLNDIYENYDEKVAKAKELADKELAGQQRIAAANWRDAQLYKHHFEFAADLANYLTDEQIEAVKDGLTYGVVPKTYQAHLEMIPTLSETEKLQILNWLKEAREFAIDAPDSKSKHAWFGKYKGRINNWLAKRGYDLTKEREAWYQRIEEAKKK
ncbi:MAG: DUF3826 domain-containing protein [Prevotella sp.]|nr:DUF3826 domain-containing protein [Prevotella sp.]